jgi:sigma54-dependent transcription regulator
VPDSKDIDKENFLYPTGRYRGEFTPARLAFNANLQEFAQRVSLLCGLETGGKITSEETYREIKRLWHELRESKRNLLDQENRPRPDLPPEEAS